MIVLEDFELTLFDRITMIQSVLQYIDEDKVYISFSGGKDSVVLSALIDEAIPHNRIDRVFCDTGIEFDAIRNFVQKLSESDDRIRIIRPGKNIRQMLHEDGYPFKSKLHSEYVERFQRSGLKGVSVRKYLDNEKPGRFSCPKVLRYQFEETFPLKVSQKCCSRLKKEPFKKFSRENGKTLTITGIRAAEGGIRQHHAETQGCVFRNADGSFYRFNPLSPCSDAFVDWYIESRNLELCELYKPPYNFSRTGCKGCPYNIDIAAELDLLETFLPAERKQCEAIWGPVYAEYRRIGYRRMKK